MIAKNPAERFSAKEALEHPFFTTKVEETNLAKTFEIAENSTCYTVQSEGKGGQMAKQYKRHCSLKVDLSVTEKNSSKNLSKSNSNNSITSPIKIRTPTHKRGSIDLNPKEFGDNSTKNLSKFAIKH